MADLVLKFWNFCYYDNKSLCRYRVNLNNTVKSDYLNVPLFCAKYSYAIPHKIIIYNSN